MAASPSLHGPRLLPLLPNPTPLPASRAPRPDTRRLRRLTTTAVPPSRNGSSAGTDWCPVPPEQRPVNEYEALAGSLPFSWAAGDLAVYCSRLAFTGAAFAVFVGLPVAAFGGRGDALHLALGATGSGILAVTLAVVRMYLGWAYVGNRLLSATVEYEETGWYDGQIWVKTPEVLARDRLLGSFSVKPVLNRVKFTLVGLAVSLTVAELGSPASDVNAPPLVPDPLYPPLRQHRKAQGAVRVREPWRKGHPRSVQRHRREVVRARRVLRRTISWW